MAKEIHIADYNYKGIKFSISFAKGEDWGDWKNKFFTDCKLNLKTRYNSDIDQLASSVKKEIDEWVSSNPKTKKEWASLFKDCFHPDGSIDTDLTILILDKYENYINLKK